MESDFVRLIRKHWPDIANPEEVEARLRRTFPDIDILQELWRAIQWEEIVAAQRLTWHYRFFVNWLSRCREGLGGSGSTAGPGSSAATRSSSGIQKTQLMFNRWDKLANQRTPRKEGAAKAAEILRGLK